MNSSVSVIIVTWNKRSDVLNLLDSLVPVRASVSHIVVVDNASTDGSVAAIRQHPLSVTLIENSENLGGTGGFNTGLRYCLKHLEQDYIWLLDNDAEVTIDTLMSLVDAMEGDSAIAVAGSCILSPEDHALIVEAGGLIDRTSGAWSPNRRYQRYELLAGKGLLEDVDYVPACSALLRASALHCVGVLDDRYFLHWDDIDLCARIRAAGYRVVVALDSRAYHGAEKGHSRMTLYYDFRNALLYFGKQGEVRPVQAILARNLASTVYLWLAGQRKVSLYLFQGLTDFLRSWFGRVSFPAEALALDEGGEAVDPEQVLAGKQKVVLFAVGSYTEVMTTLNSLRARAPFLEVTIAVAADRAQIYQLPELEPPITFDLFRDGPVGMLRTVVALLGGGYAAGISAGHAFIIPYAYLLRKNLVFDARSNSFSACDASLRTVWKLPVALATGYLLALFFLVPVLLVGHVVGRPVHKDY